MLICEWTDTIYRDACLNKQQQTIRPHLPLKKTYRSKQNVPTTIINVLVLLLDCVFFPCSSNSLSLSVSLCYQNLPNSVALLLDRFRPSSRCYFAFCDQLFSLPSCLFVRGCVTKPVWNPSTVSRSDTIPNSLIKKKILKKSRSFFPSHSYGLHGDLRQCHPEPPGVYAALGAHVQPVTSQQRRGAAPVAADASSSPSAAAAYDDVHDEWVQQSQHQPQSNDEVRFSSLRNNRFNGNCGLNGMVAFLDTRFAPCGGDALNDCYSFFLLYGQFFTGSPPNDRRNRRRVRFGITNVNP